MTFDSAHLMPLAMVMALLLSPKAATAIVWSSSETPGAIVLDTYISQEEPTVNFGDSEFIMIGKRRESMTNFILKDRLAVTDVTCFIDFHQTPLQCAICPKGFSNFRAFPLPTTMPPRPTPTTR
mmetsp:Transcript_872/g.1689  ORF Transcript_872/g.1689 Transcript_872/m.1689 type:complete len:124 (-) Transcript_872:912-1283(-)